MRQPDSARLLYGAVAGAAAFFAGAENVNTMSAENAPQSRALVRGFDQSRSHFQHLLSPDALVIASEEIPKKGESLSESMKSMDVTSLIQLMADRRFIVRDGAMQELLLRGRAVGTIDPNNPMYSPEQRMRLKTIVRNIQIIVDSERWNGSQWMLPDGWKPGEQRSAKEILMQLRRFGETGINIFDTPPIVLNARCSVPREGTPFWEVYERIRRASSEKSSINTVSTGVMYLGNATAPEFTASSGALFGEMEKRSPTSASIFFFIEGTLQLKSWKCTSASAVYPNGTRIPIVVEEREGEGNNALQLINVPPTSNEYGAPDIIVSLSCTAWPIRTSRVADFASPERQETSDKAVRFLELREEEIPTPREQSKSKIIYTVDTIDFRNTRLAHGTDGFVYENPVSSVEAVDAEGNLLPYVGDVVSQDTRRASKSYIERPASVVMRSIDLNAESRASKTLRFPWVDLRDGASQ
ncbi:MAG TPA: hypothetical protein VJB82_01910 [Candidatus Peribacterales bacterium]|nr:hypothetical protein [Candidatus Peribacterales bacterium]